MMLPVILLMLAMILQMHWYSIPVTHKSSTAWRWAADIAFLAFIIFGVLSVF